MTGLCLVLLSALITVSSNPLGQIVQSCPLCQPTIFTNPAAIPVVIQQPSNNNPYPPTATAQSSTAFTNPLGDTLNQIILNKILSNPSLQKIVDPNTKLYNQNGDEVQRQVPNTAAPNVINNYFIVPPEFFDLNATSKNEAVEIVETARKPHRRRLKKRPNKIQLSSIEEEDVTVMKAEKSKRRNQGNGNIKRKRVEAYDSFIATAAPEESQRGDAIRERDRRRNQRLHKKNKKRRPVIPPHRQNLDEDNIQEIEGHNADQEKIRHTDKRRTINQKNQSKYEDTLEKSSEANDETSVETITEEDVVFSKPKKDYVRITEKSELKTPKKERRKELDSESEDNTLKDLEMLTDIFDRNSSESRKTRDSKKSAANKETRQRITPVPDNMLNSFFPYMPSGNFNNPTSMYPYNFDQYYQYANPIRNIDAHSNRNKRKRRKHNRKNKGENANTHTIEIKLYPKKKMHNTDTSVTSKAEDVTEKIDSSETERSTESLELATEIPMQIPQKVFPKYNDEENLSKETYDTFSKLEDLYEFITPELGSEDIVPAMHSNGIINDYYPVFDDDVYYAPYVEDVKSLDDDRYYYETGDQEFSRERRKNDIYEDIESITRDNEQFGYTRKDETRGKGFIEPNINKFDHNEYLDHISSFSDTERPEYQMPSSEIRRVQVPSRNTRAKTENIETIFAESKVAKYGVPSKGRVDDSSYVSNSNENSYTANDHTAYVFAKSLGRPEDYW